MLNIAKNIIPGFHGLGEISRKSVTMARFFREFVRMPCQVGSICPSSKALASLMARHALGAPENGNGLLVDLGAGTGIVTEQLLRMGVNPKYILALDISEHFRSQFYRNCGSIPFVIADAGNLARIMDRDYPELPLRAIISSLPLRTIPEAKVKMIMSVLRHCLLQRGGLLVQYTYALWMREALSKYGFALCARRTVYFNVPPALVEAYKPV